MIGIFVGFMLLGLGVAAWLDRGDREPAPTELADKGPVPVESFVLPETTIVREVDPEQPQPAWRRNAVPFSGPADRPRLAVVVLDDGLDARSTMRAIRLNAPVTLAVAPTVEGARSRVDAARRLKREVLLLLPMESEARLVTAPNPIAAHIGREELLRRLSWNLAQIDGYVGVINRHGEKTSRDAQTMRTVMETLHREGLLFVDSRSHADSVAGAVARRMGVPAGDRNAAVRLGDGQKAVIETLAEAEAHAREWGDAIVTIPAERGAIDTLKRWLRTRKSDVVIAPVSAVIGRLRSGAS